MEDLLSCWARDPKAFARADERLTAFLDQVIAQSQTPDTSDLERLQSLRGVWSTLTDQLLNQR